MSTVPIDFWAALVRKEQVSKDAFAFYFERSQDFSFTAGQYIKVILPHENPDQRGTTRLFSIITSPLNTNEFGIATRILQSSFKKALAALEPGIPVQFSGPRGVFVLDESDQAPRVLLAGGVGVTPFHSIVLYAAEKQLTIPLTLFVSFSTADDVMFYEELKEASEKNSNIKIVYTVTRPEESPASQARRGGQGESVAGRHKPWQGEIGRISQELINKYVQNVSDSIYMLAGPPPMVEAMNAILGEMGVSVDKIKRENFTGY